jgi:hypothetical protein
MEQDKLIERVAALAEEKEDRREFMRVAAKFAGVLAALGITAEAWASGTTAPGAPMPGAKGEQMIKLNPAQSRKLATDVLKDAIRTGDLDASLGKHKAAGRLAPGDLQAIKGLDKADLQALNRIQGKLGDLAKGGDTGGLFW